MKTLLIFLAIFLTVRAENPVQDFIKANNLFTPKVYKEVTKTKTGNFLVSPFSAETILSLTLSGARGQSAEELRQALNLPNDKNKIESDLKALLPKFKSNEFYTLTSANKMYVKENLGIKDEFKSSAAQIYSAESENIDFSKNVEAAKVMNDWVEKHTNNKIKNLIESDDLDDKTAAVLINALYFKSNWSQPFDSAVTKKRQFYVTPSDSKEVETLHHYQEEFKYYECPHLKAQFLELPFQGGEASMVIVLPNEKNGLSNLESHLDQVFNPQHELKSEYVNVALPKLKIETSTNWKGILQNLGVSEIFQGGVADLSGIAGEKGGLFVDKVAQKTFIDVNEEGVEAAAATYVAISIESAVLVTPKDFIADHPFIFYIKIKDVIAFAGRVTDPSLK